jgi:aminopeptidase
VTPDERLRRYAELAVRIGANLQQGQDVVVTCLVEHAPIARAVAREAYRAGAQHVVLLYNDLHLRRAAIELGPESEVGWSAPYVLDWVRRWPEENPAVISLSGNPTPDLLADLDPALVGRADPKDLRQAMLENVANRHVLDDRRRAERRVGDTGLRGTGRRATLGCRGPGDAARSARPCRGMA